MEFWDIDIGSSDFITTGKAYYSNVFSATGIYQVLLRITVCLHTYMVRQRVFCTRRKLIELANAATTLAGYGSLWRNYKLCRHRNANLIDSAPGALDTLNELAASDDATSTTVTNSLATKAPLADPALTGTPTAHCYKWCKYYSNQLSICAGCSIRIGWWWWRF